MTRNHKYDYLMRAGLGKGAKKAVKIVKNPIDAAMLEFEHMETGLGELSLQIPFISQAPPSQFPIQRAPIPMARPRSAQEIEVQAKAAEKPGIVQQILTPITNIAVLGIGAIVFVNVVPSLLEFLAKSRQKKE